MQSTLQEPDDSREMRGGPFPLFWAGAIAATAVVGMLAIALGIIALSIGQARAHEAPPSKSQPLGWQYGAECCSLMDCAPVDSGGISETPQGYRVNLTGEVIPYSDKRIKQSRDEFFHRCAPGGRMEEPKSICLYVPDRGF